MPNVRFDVFVSGKSETGKTASYIGFDRFKGWVEMFHNLILRTKVRKENYMFNIVYFYLVNIWFMLI